MMCVVDRADINGCAEALIGAANQILSGTNCPTHLHGPP